MRLLVVLVVSVILGAVAALIAANADIPWFWHGLGIYTCGWVLGMMAALVGTLDAGE